MTNVAQYRIHTRAEKRSLVALSRGAEKRSLVALSRRAAHPELAPRVLAAAVAYLRHAGDADSDDVTRALPLIAD
jgi:hypothetical protein